MTAAAPAAELLAAAAAADVDLATLLVRLVQIATEQPPEHWLWQRVMECDVPRLREQLSPAMQELLDALTAGLTGASS